MNDLEYVLTVLAVLLAVALGVLEDIAYTESLTMSRVNNHVSGLVLVLGVVLAVRAVDVRFNLFESAVFVEDVVSHTNGVCL